MSCRIQDIYWSMYYSFAIIYGQTYNSLWNCLNSSTYLLTDFRKPHISVLQENPIICPIQEMLFGGSNSQQTILKTVSRQHRDFRSSGMDYLEKWKWCTHCLRVCTFFLCKNMFNHWKMANSLASSEHLFGSCPNNSQKNAVKHLIVLPVFWVFFANIVHV